MNIGPYGDGVPPPGQEPKSPAPGSQSKEPEPKYIGPYGDGVDPNKDR